MDTKIVEVEDGRVAVGLMVPEDAAHVVVVVQGSTHRLTKKARAIGLAARALGAGVVTVSVLTPEEAAADKATGAVRFDVGRLGRRLAAVLAALPEWTGDRALSLHGTGTGAAAALVAAAARPGSVRSLVSVAGRPDLARPVLSRVAARTLLVVGGKDLAGVRACCDALCYLPKTAQLALVPGAVGLDDEPEQREVAQLIAGWLAGPNGASFERAADGKGGERTDPRNAYERSDAKGKVTP